MVKKRPITNSDITRAKEFISRYGTVNLLNLNRGDLAEMVNFYYPRINGIPLKNVPNAQLYRIAQRLRNQAYEITRQGRNTGLEGVVSS